MTIGQFDVRPVYAVAVLLALAITIATAQVTPAEANIDESLTVVSSTVLGEDTFTMTAWNAGLTPIDVSLLPPGVVSAVSVDAGDFDGIWTIAGLESGATGTMTGFIES